jgi:putative FmdB family regulatory protein
VPTYQYACTECGHAFEEFQSFADDALTVCPQCEGKLRKVYNAVGVVFKGSGFYRTDSREKSSSSTSNGSKAESSGSEKSEKSEKSESTKSETSKPEKSSTSSESSSSTKAAAPA